MRKTALFLVLVIIIMIPLSVHAGTRELSIKPTLSFNGSTATCKSTVVGDNTSQHIEVTMKLMYGTSTVASWSAEGYGYVFLNKTAAVVVGRTYKLQVEVTIDGIEKDPVYVTGTC